MGETSLSENSVIQTLGRVKGKKEFSDGPRLTFFSISRINSGINKVKQHKQKLSNCQRECVNYVGESC